MAQPAYGHLVTPTRTGNEVTSRQNPRWVLVVLSGLMAFASISTDLYLPAMPAMAASLQGREGAMEWTVSAYLVGFSAGQLFWGPVGDRLGRRLPIMLGLSLFIVGSVGCATASSANGLIAMRVVQALGACASVALGRAMVRDLYAGHRAAQVMSTLMAVMTIAPLVGPTLGGQVLALGGWRLIFWCLVALGAITMMAVFQLPETLPRGRRRAEPVARIAGHYIALLTDPRFRRYAGGSGLFYGGIFAYVAGTPSAYISYYGISPQHYGVLFAGGVVGIMMTNLFNARWVARYGADTLFRVGTGVAAMAGVGTVGCVGLAPHALWPLVLSLFVFVGCTGFIVANAIACALDAAGGHVGAASALIGAIQYGAGIVGSCLVGSFADGTPMPMAAVIAAMSLGGVCYAFAGTCPPRVTEMSNGRR
jgi:MFS transporter, DHA1 family, multidrug resistance protein